MGMLKNIEWTDNSRDTLVYKVDCKNDYIAKGSALTVRDSQVAIFSTMGKMADVFLPGFYKLDTNSIPIITKLASWKYGFENPFRSDVYFVSTKQYPNQKWGTKNPIIIRDKDYGAVRVRAFGTFSFKVKDAFVFMQEISGTGRGYASTEIVEYLKSILITGLTDAIGESKIPVLEMAGNQLELGKYAQNAIQPRFNALGLELKELNFENFSLPEELEKALDKNSALGIQRGNWDMQMQQAQMEALKTAAGNPGAGGIMGAGMGMGMGMGMGHMFGNMMQPIQTAPPPPSAPAATCKKCGANLAPGAKFCPACGAPTATLCTKCGTPLADGAKFCPNCGQSTAVKCPACGANVPPGTKFCPECGAKI